jgi:lysophospholipase L1-like esterase
MRTGCFLLVLSWSLAACSSGGGAARDSGTAGAGAGASGAAGGAGAAAGATGGDGAAGTTAPPDGGGGATAPADASLDADGASAPADAASDVPDADARSNDAAADVLAPAPAVRFVGRIDRGDAKGPRFAWSGSGVVASFSGTSVGVKLGGGQQYTVVLDGVVKPKLVPGTTMPTATTMIATGLPPGPHTVELYRRTEPEWGESQFLGFDFGAGALLAPPPAPARRLEIIGDSITTGFGNEGTDPCQYTIDTENHYLTWGAVAARAVGAEVVTTAWEGKGLVCNVGDGPCTMPFPTYYDRTLPMRADSAWDFKSWIPHAVVINLGTNDFSSAVDPTPTEFATGYVNFLKHIRGNYPDALILLTCGPMLGAGELKKVTDGIATAIATVGDARIKSFDLPIQSGPTGCLGHPNVATNQKMADVLAAKLKAELGW